MLSRGKASDRIRQLRLVAMSRPLTPDELDCLRILVNQERKSGSSSRSRGSSAERAAYRRAWFAHADPGTIKRIRLAESNHSKWLHRVGKLALAKLEKGESVSPHEQYAAARYERRRLSARIRARLTRQSLGVGPTKRSASTQITLLKKEICRLIIILGQEES